ncbi:MAG: hypothetical protein QM791_15045 [Ferruginibacter sp.]
MSLTNIQLPVSVIRDLYKTSLVETAAPAKPAAVAEQNVSINFLGKNRKQIIILVTNADSAFLPDEELNFLLGILSACRLTMEDVGIINFFKNKNLTYNKIAKEIQADKVFLFGISPEQISLPLGFPYYQVQSYNNQTYLSAPALDTLKDDRAEKGKLWNSLKTIFSI